MSFVYFTNKTFGIPKLEKANGSLCVLLDWVLPLAGWTILFSDGFARVYRSQNGRLLHVNHDSVASGSVNRAVVRGCAGASGAKTIAGAFPTIAQADDNFACWRFDNNPSGIFEVPFEIVANSNYLLMMVPRTAARNVVDVWFFGETLSDFSQDGNCLINITRSASAVTSANQGLSGAVAKSGSLSAAGMDMFWQGNVDGSYASTPGFIFGSGFGVTGAPVARGGYENRIYREPVVVGDYGGTGSSPTPMCLVKRGYIPHIWTLLHSGMGALEYGDTFLDAQYDPGAVFKASDLLVYEITDTWRPR